MNASISVFKSGQNPQTWTVEACDIDHDGSVDVTIFSGPGAEARAREYAQWKYGDTQAAKEAA